MKTFMTGVVATFLCTALASCASPSFFPPGMTADATTHVEFGMLEGQIDVFKGRAIQLAGRIVDVQEVDKGTLIVAQQLPIQEYPAYGPGDTTKPTGRIIVLYPGRMDQSALWRGNKFIVVAEVEGSRMVSLEGVPRKEPSLRARCMHVWKTGNYYEISDFPNIADGYYPLEEQTYCIR